MATLAIYGGHRLGHDSTNIASYSRRPLPQIPADGYDDGGQYITTFFCRALYDYRDNDASYLSFQEGDIIEVLSQLESGWWDGLLRDERGWLPSNYVAVISDEEPEAEAVLSASESSPQNPISADSIIIKKSVIADDTEHAKSQERISLPRQSFIAGEPSHHSQTSSKSTRLYSPERIVYKEYRSKGDAGGNIIPKMVQPLRKIHVESTGEASSVVQVSAASSPVDTAAAFLPSIDDNKESFIEPQHSVNAKRLMSLELPDLTGQITTHSKFSKAAGGFADVFKATWNKDSEQCEVAIKVLRFYASDDDKETKRKTKKLHRELRIWKRLNHPNIVQLYGITYGFAPCASMVCPWLERGDLNTYLERHMDISLPDKLQMICEVANGLSYLHQHSIIHGDLTGTNVLLDAQRKCCLSDFGLSVILAEFQNTSYLTSVCPGAYRWAAPELFSEISDEGLSIESDVYSFGSVMLQIISGKVPYYDLKRDAQVLMQICQGRPPRRPDIESMKDRYWEFISHCWSFEPSSRPVNICNVVQDWLSACKK